MKRILTLLLTISCLGSLYGQVDQNKLPVKVLNRDSVSTISTLNQGVDTIYRTDIRNTVTIFFRFDKSNIDSTYLTNSEALEFIQEQLSNPSTVKSLDSLQLSAISSPEGPLSYNKGLSMRRVHSFRDYLITTYPLVESKIKIGYSGEEWDNLRRMIVESTKIPNKDQVMEIINSDLDLDTKESRLKELNDGEPWRFIVYNMLRYLRYGGTAIFYYNTRHVEGDIPVKEPEKVVEVEKEVVKEVEQSPIEPLYERKPLLAFKTNLLFDALSVLNISAEVPLSQRISLSGEWTFPWWICDNKKIDSKRHRIQLLYGNLEARYWFGNRDNRAIMTGWFAGLYGGGGKYDFEYNKDGVQGEFYSAGLCAGYAHTINKKHTLRMEYSATAGYVDTDYRDYNTIFADSFDDAWHPIRRSTGHFTTFAPTSVKVSLVWMLYYNRLVKGGRK